MRIPLALPLLLLVGCGSGSSPSDAGQDSGCLPSALLCVREFGGTLVSNATLSGTQPGEIPFAGRTGTNGCGTLDLPAGRWTLRATTPSMCTSEPIEVAVPTCGVVEVTLDATLCTDGSL